MQIRDRIDEYFRSKSVEYYAIISYSDASLINPSLIDREDFIPKSCILFLLPYYTERGENLSSYAISYDYHLAIREVSDGLTELLGELCPGSSSKGYGDHSPIDERHAALISGLSVLGDSGLLINEKYGTYVFVGDVICDISPSLLGASEPCEIKYCEHCGRCKAACPTGILRREGTDCLSAITQRKGELTDEQISLMREYNTVWGCDECQRSCPHNAHPVRTPIEFFYKDRIPRLDSDILSSLDKESFSKRAFAWRGRKTVERNLDVLK